MECRLSGLSGHLSYASVHIQDPKVFWPPFTWVALTATVIFLGCTCPLHQAAYEGFHDGFCLMCCCFQKRLPAGRPSANAPAPLAYGAA
jgi:hypothetical protein